MSSYGKGKFVIGGQIIASYLKLDNNNNDNSERLSLQQQINGEKWIIKLCLDQLWNELYQ